MNIVTATFSAGCTQIDADRKLWQYDQGQVLQLVGLDLPDAYQVEFSNTRDKGSAKAQIGGPDGVQIPDEYLTTGKPVYAFLVGHTAEEDRETEKLVVIYVNARSQPTDEPITPEQQNIVDQLIAALTAGVEKAEDAAAQAEAAISFMPKIVDGTWWVYDAETETWADTGIQAEGEDGVGISGAVLNADYTLTLTFSDGSSYTTPSIRGAQGERGPIGPTPDISIGTVTTGAAGSQAEATMTGTPERPVLNLTIPRGDPGEVTQAEFDELADEVALQKSAIDELDSAFDYTRTAIVLSAFVAGKYMATNGTLTDQVACQYATAEITEELVGKTLLISGSAWWAVMPYVFIASDSTIEYADIPAPGGTLTQYTDLEFEPDSTGTLYINIYSSGSVVHVGKADYLSLSSLKDTYLPNDIGNSILDALSYQPITLTMIDGKRLSGSTGVITDVDSPSQRVSDYIDVDGDTWYLLSTEHFWNSGMYAWYDENKIFISGVNANSGGTVTQIYCQKVKSPQNAKYLVIGYLYQNSYPFPFVMKGIMSSITPSKRWSGKKWACVGDSLTASYAVTGAHYFDLISAITGITAVNMGVSGSGYARGTNNFMTRALTVPTDADVVTFFGSGNDSGAGLELGTASDTGTSTLGGCINTAIDNLYSIMPVVQLGIVTPTPWQGNMPSDNGWMENYANLIVAICKRRSIPCLDLFHCSNLNPNSPTVRAIAYARDGGGGVHPSEAGHAIIAPRFLAFLESLLMH